MGGAKNALGPSPNWYEENPKGMGAVVSAVHSQGTPDWSKLTAFGRTHTDAPPPAKGQSYDAYRSDYDASHTKPADIPAPTSASLAAVPQGPPDPKLAGQQVITPPSSTAPIPTVPTVSGAPSAILPTANATQQQLPPVVHPKMAMSGAAGEPAAPMNQAPATAQTGLGNPAKNAANPALANQKTSSNNWSMPSTGGIKFGGY